MAEMIYALGLSTVFSMVITPMMLKLLIKLKTGQNIREDGPRAHLAKAGTPSMGGLIFILTTIVMFLLIGRSRFFNLDGLFVVVSLLLYGLIGFIDDYLKIVKKVNEGLKAKQKLILQLLFGAFIGVWAIFHVGSEIMIPFTKGYMLDLKWLYVPFVVFFMTAISNGTNLTDGLDGLLTSVSILVVTFFAAVSYGLGNYTLALVCAILAGGLLGYLRVNSYPASVFMGDTGSMAIGGFIGAVAIILQLELIIIIVGGIYLLETLSVIIQVTVFKKTGKRVFKMSPLHHHFECLGWHENKIVSTFSIITVLLCLIGFLAII